LALFAWRTYMAVAITRRAGMLLLSIWLVLTELAGRDAILVPHVLMAGS
jgi:hypothetical protein